MNHHAVAMFPGQGSQYLGMGKELVREFPYCAAIFEEAEDAISVPIRKLCFDGPEDELTATANTQPCILTLSIAVYKVLTQEAGYQPEIYMGHSLGEYSAVVASGKLAFADAVSLVRKRGEAMQRAVPLGKGAMAAILNLAEEKLQGLCHAAIAEAVPVDGGPQTVEIVNYNSPQQLVIAGHKGAVDAVVAAAGAIEGVRAVPLATSAPFHSSLMVKAREEMTPLLEGTTFTETSSEVIANITAASSKDYGAELLIKQIDGPVKWSTSLVTAFERGARHFTEVGPGKVLFGLARKNLPRSECTLLNSENITDTIQKLS